MGGASGCVTVHNGLGLDVRCCPSSDASSVVRTNARRDVDCVVGTQCVNVACALTSCSCSLQGFTTNPVLKEKMAAGGVDFSTFVTFFGIM